MMKFKAGNTSLISGLPTESIVLVSNGQEQGLLWHSLIPSLPNVQVQFWSTKGEHKSNKQCPRTRRFWQTLDTARRTHNSQYTIAVLVGLCALPTIVTEGKRTNNTYHTTTEPNYHTCNTVKLFRAFWTTGTLKSALESQSYEHNSVRTMVHLAGSACSYPMQLSQLWSYPTIGKQAENIDKYPAHVQGAQ